MDLLRLNETSCSERRIVEQSLLDIFRASGDANIGKTLLRLARLAEAAHQFETVKAMRDARSDAEITDHQRRAEGLSPRPVVNPGRVERHAGASVGKEADR